MKTVLAMFPYQNTKYELSISLSLEEVIYVYFTLNLHILKPGFYKEYSYINRTKLVKKIVRISLLHSQWGSDFGQFEIVINCKQNTHKYKK